MKTFQSMFDDEIGTLQHLETDPEVLPSVSRVRRMLHAISHDVKAELQRNGNLRRH